MRFLMVLMICALPVGAMAEDARQMVVTGQARVEVPPDMATITLAVTKEDDDAAAAIGAMSTDVAAILAGLTGAGLAATDVQTQQLQLNPLWSKASSISKTRPSIQGFSATSRISVRIRDLDQLGRLLDQVVTLGANGFQSLEFGLQDPRPTTDEARRKAVVDAQAKAALYAQAAGVTLGPILSISEQTIGGPINTRGMSDAFMSEVPVAAGAISITAQVSIVFSLID